MQVDFRQGDSPLEGDKTKHVGLISSDELLSSMCRIVHGKERLQGKEADEVAGAAGDAVEVGGAAARTRGSRGILE